MLNQQGKLTTLGSELQFRTLECCNFPICQCFIKNKTINTPAKLEYEISNSPKHLQGAKNIDVSKWNYISLCN